MLHSYVFAMSKPLLGHINRHAVHKMRLIATDVTRSMVGVSVCVLVTRRYRTKMAELI